MTGLCSFQNHWVCVSQEGGIETGRCAVLTHTPLWSSWGSKTGNKSLSPFSGPLGFSQSIALFEYLRFLEGSAFCSSKTTGTILGVEGHHPCATLHLLEVRNGGYGGAGGRMDTAFICVLVSFWKTSPKLMSVQGEVAAKMTECQHIYDLS